MECKIRTESGWFSDELWVTVSKPTEEGKLYFVSQDIPTYNKVEGFIRWLFGRAEIKRVDDKIYYVDRKQYDDGISALINSAKSIEISDQDEEQYIKQVKSVLTGSTIKHDVAEKFESHIAKVRVDQYNKHLIYNHLNFYKGIENIDPRFLRTLSIEFSNLRSPQEKFAKLYMAYSDFEQYYGKNEVLTAILTSGEGEILKFVHNLPDNFLSDSSQNEEEIPVKEVFDKFKKLADFIMSHKY